jgi:hypothetical protein
MVSRNRRVTLPSVTDRLTISTCVLAALGALFAGCNDDDPRNRPSCSDVLADAGPNVAGTYRYAGPLRGTIALEQTGTTVRLVKTTYDNADDRPLVGEGTLSGNELRMRMVPENGDTDYEAQVRFVFDRAGDGFCVEFSDTNDDRGGLGSYVGRRL